MIVLPLLLLLPPVSISFSPSPFPLETRASLITYRLRCSSGREGWSKGVNVWRTPWTVMWSHQSIAIRRLGQWGDSWKCKNLSRIRLDCLWLLLEVDLGWCGSLEDCLERPGGEVVLLEGFVLFRPCIAWFVVVAHRVLYLYWVCVSKCTWYFLVLLSFRCIYLIPHSGFR